MLAEIYYDITNIRLSAVLNMADSANSNISNLYRWILQWQLLLLGYNVTGVFTNIFMRALSRVLQQPLEYRTHRCQSGLQKATPLCGPKKEIIP